MFFTLEGRVKNKEAVDIYVSNMLKELNLHRREASELSIKFVTKCDGDVLGLACGGCRWGEIEIARSSRGEKLQFLEQMLTLAHEMIHIKQYMKGEMTDEPKAIWHGRNHDKTPYTKQPWEVEAHKLEYELFAKSFPWWMPIN